MSEGKCRPCGSPKHKIFLCTKYTRSNFPENLPTPGDRKQIKRQRSFDSQQPKKLAYLPWYLARWERMDERKIALQSLGMRVLMTTLHEIQPHQISLRSRVVSDSPKALMSSQDLGGTARPDSSHTVHEVQIRDQHGELQRIRALIDYGAISIFISPHLLHRLGLPHEPAQRTTHSLHGQVIMHVRDSLQNGDHSAIYASLNPTPRTGGASRPNGGI